MTNLLTRARDILTGRAPYGSPRSPKWPAFRKAHIGKECVGCGSTRRLELHHITPFHKDFSRELDVTNVVTLCAACHLFLGHLDSWESWNVDVVKDAETWRGKIMGRPK